MVGINEEIRGFFSEARLEKYEKIKFKAENLSEVYETNINLSGKILGAISLFEVFLRNSIFKSIQQKYGPFGLFHTSFFASLKYHQKDEILYVLKEIDESICSVRDATQKSVSQDLIISRVGLKFWINMFDVKNKILNDEVYFTKIFPKFKSIDSKERVIRIQEMFSQLEAIRKLRNRICHHENILKHDFQTAFNYMALIISYFDNSKLDCYFEDTAKTFEINKIFEGVLLD